jgi:hypothetical protein
MSIRVRSAVAAAGMLALAIGTVTQWPSVAGAAPAKMRDFDFEAYFAAKYPDCLEGRERALRVFGLTYHDFDRDGRDEAILVAGTCYAGTGGPDIHAVYRLDQTGALREIAVDPSPGAAHVSGVPLGLIGNRNFVFKVKNDRLCEEWSDGSGRPVPMERCYRYEQGIFRLKQITYGRTYRPSFSCTAAKSDREIAVCSNEKLARLDRELAEIYKKTLAALSGSERRHVTRDQRAWLAQAHRWHAYKWCCDELVKMYRARIEALTATSR